MEGQPKLDEFAIVLLAGVVLIGILMIAWNTPQEFTAEVNPLSVELEIQNGTSQTFSLNISRVGARLTNVTIKTQGEIADWLNFQRSTFDVVDNKIVPITVIVPDSAKEKTYNGKVIISSLGGTVEVEVSVKVSVAKKITSRSFDLVDFVVGYKTGTGLVSSKEDVVISQGYFSSKEEEMVGIIDEDQLEILNGGSIQILVDDTNSLGDLIVLFNDEEVYHKVTGKGEVQIQIDPSKIKKVNNIVVKASGPGFAFWANTVYVLKNIKFSISFEGAFSQEIPFELSKNEFQNFDHLQLTYLVKDFSLPLPKMTIKVNDQKIFFERPTTGIFNRNFDQSLGGVKINLDEKNIISFSFDEEAFYHIGNAVLTVFYRTR